MCCDRSEEAAARTAHKYFRWALTGWPVMAELPDARGFEAATAQISPQVVAEKISCGPSAEKHLAAIRKYVKAGFDHIILVQIGPNQEAFFELFQRELAPALRAAKGR
jgi:hypothetical protein